MSRRDSQFKLFGLPAFRSRKGNALRRAVLERNKRLRDGRDPKPKTLGNGGGFAGVLLSIPELDYQVIKIMYPEVNSRNATERRNAWIKFANSPEGEPYRVDRHRRGVPCRSLTAR